MSLKFRRHFKLVVLLSLIAAVLIVGLGDQRIVAYTVQGSEATAQQSTTPGNQAALPGDTLVDSIQILIAGTNWSELYAH